MKQRELPTGVFEYGERFRSEIKVNRKTVHLGIYDTVEEAVEAQNNYRKENNIPKPVRGRPWSKVK